MFFCLQTLQSVRSVANKVFLAALMSIADFFNLIPPVQLFWHFLLFWTRYHQASGDDSVSPFKLWAVWRGVRCTSSRPEVKKGACCVSADGREKVLWGARCYTKNCERSILFKISEYMWPLKTAWWFSVGPLQVSHLPETEPRPPVMIKLELEATKLWNRPVLTIQ